jgi:ferredoxin
MSDTDAEAAKWLDLNAKSAKIWPNITARQDPLSDADEWLDKPDKLSEFDPKPAAV